MVERKKLVVVGTFTAILYLAIGIASIVVQQIDSFAVCGNPGFPPLSQWLLGTGISYIIIGCSYFMVAYVKIWSGLFYTIICLAGAFLFCWMIVGSVSLWRDGYDCISANFPLWQMGMAAVILSLIMFVFFGFTFKIYKDEQEDSTSTSP